MTESIQYIHTSNSLSYKVYLLILQNKLIYFHSCCIMKIKLNYPNSDTAKFLFKLSVLIKYFSK